MQEGYRLVTVRTHCGFIVLPHWETKPSTHYPDIEPTSPCPILLTLTISPTRDYSENYFNPKSLPCTPPPTPLSNVFIFRKLVSVSALSTNSSCLSNKANPHLNNASSFFFSFSASFRSMLKSSSRLGFDGKTKMIIGCRWDFGWYLFLALCSTKPFI